ncbi:multicopper oxidase domain-containing protein, partial [Nostocoides japonicum]|uniref:multicopper oxidase domain-containing protein n=1 Tax=Nostocoides japonicum TaxID=99481 RepID=UPI00138F84DB
AGAAAAPADAPGASRGVRVQVVSGLALIAMAVSVGVAIDPASAGLAGPESGAGVSAAGTAIAPTGHTTRVLVTARDMHYDPASIDVPAGDRLVIELVNADPDTSHDLTFGSDLHTRRLRPGQHAVLDVGVVSRSLEGWCSVVGHRMRGMTLQVQVVGAPTAGATGTSGSSSGTDGEDGSTAHDGTGHSAEQAAPTGPSPSLPPSALDVDRAAAAPVDPVLPPLSSARTHRITLRATTTTLEVAPGVWQRRWAYNGQVPGPTLHGRVGDTFIVTLVNDTDMGHSIDFHAGERAPDKVMRTIPPGGRLTYRFTARRAGIWLYHCSTMPMSAHIAAGMFGAVVIEPPGLPRVDRSYLLVQSEAYLDTTSGTSHDAAAEVDAEKVSAERPDAVTFNGQAFQYDHTPLTARVGERVRIWVLDAGPDRATSFHVVGSQFDTVYLEGGYLLRHGRDAFGSSDAGGSQALALQPGQGGFVELTPREPGSYPVVSHIMVDAERGAHGILRVTP